MESLRDINERIIEVVKQISSKSYEAERLRERYLMDKAKYDNDMAMYLLTVKAESPDMTDQMVKAKATNLAYESNISRIRSECAFKALRNEIRHLKDELESLKDVSNNKRMEAKI